MSIVKKVVEGDLGAADSDLKSALDQKKDRFLGDLRAFIGSSFLSAKGLVGINYTKNGGVGLDKA
jgi:hypothetical protein